MITPSRIPCLDVILRALRRVLPASSARHPQECIQKGSLNFTVAFNLELANPVLMSMCRRMLLNVCLNVC